MAAKKGKLTANREKKEQFLRRDFGDLVVKIEVGDVTFPIVVLKLTDFGNDWGKGHGIASEGREALALASKSAFSLPGRTAELVTHWQFKVVLLEREETRTKHSQGIQAGDKRELMKGLRVPIGIQVGKGLTGICRSTND